MNKQNYEISKRCLLVVVALLALSLTVFAQSAIADRPGKTTQGKVSAEPVSRQPVSEFPGFGARTITRADNERGAVATLKYDKLPDMLTPRLMHQAFATTDGGLVVAGGHTTDFIPTKTAEIYKNGQWHSLTISTAHDGGFCVRLSDGRTMVGGGFSQKEGVGRSKRTDIFNPKTGTFTTGPQMTTARARANAINVGGRVYVSGNWYAEDKVMDCYNGSSFSAVGNMDSRSNPYMMTDKDGNVVVLAIYDPQGDPLPFYTYPSGAQGWVADCYDISTGETTYMGTPYDTSLIPTDLPDEMCPSDYHFTADGQEYYAILAMQATDDGDDYRYVVLLYNGSESKTYVLTNVEVPTRHPVTGQDISWRGGVYVNQAKREMYLIGDSYSKQTKETVHIMSISYAYDSWTLGSASGFDSGITMGAWTLLSDGRLACTGSWTDSNYHPSAEAYIFTPPTAGKGDDTPGPQTLGQTLVVLTKNGAKTEFVLKDRPLVKFEGKSLRVTSDRADVTFALADVVNFTYVNNDPSGINELLADDDSQTELSYQDGTLVLSQLRQGAVVGIYTTDGKLVRQLKAHRQGTYRISLAALPKGIYIVKADTINYKIMKR